MTWQPYVNTGKPLPTQPFNLRALFGNIENQGVLNGCTAFATLQAFAVMRKKQGYPWQIFSQLAEWYMSRKLYGEEINNPNWVNENQGVMEDNALQVLIDDGVVPQAKDLWNTQVMMGNWVKAYQTEPPQSDWVTSIKLRPTEVFQISTANMDQALLDVRDALANNNPVLWSGLVFDNWFNCSGIIPDTPPGTKAAGGHEINIIGDDPANQRLLILNQWSPMWGIQVPAELNGCAWMSYTFFKTWTQELFVLIPDGLTPPATQPNQPTPTVQLSVSFAHYSVPHGTPNAITIHTSQPNQSFTVTSQGPLPQPESWSGTTDAQGNFTRDMMFTLVGLYHVTVTCDGVSQTVEVDWS